MNNNYNYQPKHFFSIVFIFTWLFWIGAIALENNGLKFFIMLLGLFVPAVTALYLIFSSKNPGLKRDLKIKLFSFKRVKLPYVLLAIIMIFVVVTVSILLSTFFGQSLNQFSFTEDYSFSIGGVSTLITLVITAIVEELGWRSYAVDSLANSYNWFKTSLIFGFIWSLWHVPLFFISDTYQAGVLQQSPWFMVSFLVGIVPFAIIFTWVYIKNNRSILACMFFHFFTNLTQEGVAMTQVTKAVETLVFIVAAVIILFLNKDLFFSKNHIGKLPDNID